ncbi:MAG: hypothetical protein K9J06_08065 [Flavobacteriales bacterium]|nr:hypothetical protein [Flavobacteriales bacterium]
MSVKSTNMFRSMKLRIIPVVTMVLAWASCEAPQPKDVNPNGSSELAILMREMFDDGERIKAQVQRGEEPTGLRDFAAIHAAIPTDSTVKTLVFTAFAESYLESVRQLEADDSTSVYRFNRMVDQCMNCHSEFCPGPKKRIRKLYIE